MNKSELVDSIAAQADIPKENEKDLREIPQNIQENLEIIPVAWIDEVLDIALESKPEPLVGEIVSKEEPKTKKDGKSRPNTH